MQRIIETSGDIKIQKLDNIPLHQTVHMMKIDEEGMELSVLEGASEILKKDKPSLYIEAHNIETFEEIYSFLNKFSYVYCDTLNATLTHLFLHKNCFGKCLNKVRSLLYKKVSLFYTITNNQSTIKNLQIKSNQLLKICDEERLKQKKNIDELEAERKENKELLSSLSTFL